MQHTMLILAHHGRCSTEEKGYLDIMHAFLPAATGLELEHGHARALLQAGDVDVRIRVPRLPCACATACQVRPHAHYGASPIR